MRYIQIRKIEQRFGRKMAAKRSSRLRFAQTAAYKMSRSVSRVLLSYGHLSRRTVAGTLQPPRERPGKPNAPISVLLRIEFTAADAFTRRRVSSYLAFPPLPADAQTPSRRYISVALFLKSPSAGVTRYPCPVEPGLSSCERRWALARGCPFRSLYYCTLFFFLCQTDCKISFCRL